MKHHTNQEDITNIDKDALYEKLIDAQTPGLTIVFDPDEASRAGAFIEDALSIDEAIESSFDAIELTIKTTAAECLEEGDRQ